MKAFLKEFLAALAVGVVFTTSGVAATMTLVPPGATWRYLKGTEEASVPDAAAWRQVEFDDSGWLVGPEPILYGEPLGGTELPDMRGGYTSVYFRQAFELASPTDLSSLTLNVLSDDGFVAW